MPTKCLAATWHTHAHTVMQHRWEQINTVIGVNWWCHPRGQDEEEVLNWGLSLYMKVKGLRAKLYPFAWVLWLRHTVQIHEPELNWEAVTNSWDWLQQLSAWGKMKRWIDFSFIFLEILSPRMSVMVLSFISVLLSLKKKTNKTKSLSTKKKIT